MPPPPPQPSPPPTGPVGQSPAGRTGPPVALAPPPLAPPRFPPRGWPKFDNEGQEVVPLAERQRSLIVAAIEATRVAQAALAPFGHMLHLVLQFPEPPVASTTCPTRSAMLFLRHPLSFARRACTSAMQIYTNCACEYAATSAAILLSVKRDVSMSVKAAVVDSLSVVKAIDIFPRPALNELRLRIRSNICGSYSNRQEAFRCQSSSGRRLPDVVKGF
jgi:hypothetical protein